MKPIHIFIASSEELHYERLLFSYTSLMLNQLLEDKGIKFVVEVWEHLDSSMSKERKQTQYNNVLKKCDICIALFWTKFGDYTKEEFETAQAECAENNTLKQVYVYFKDPTEDSPISEELSAFKQHCQENAMPSFDFNDDNTLTYHLVKHLDAYCQKYFNLAITREEDGKLKVAHKTLVDLASI